MSRHSWRRVQSGRAGYRELSLTQSCLCQQDLKHNNNNMSVTITPVQNGRAGYRELLYYHLPLLSNGLTAPFRFSHTLTLPRYQLCQLWTISLSLTSAKLLPLITPLSWWLPYCCSLYAGFLAVDHVQGTNGKQAQPVWWLWLGPAQSTCMSFAALPRIPEVVDPSSPWNVFLVIFAQTSTW